ncbi:MAG: GxxExxY protein [bacterium]|nr:GxxExxY protein [bacterium]MDF1525767.1 GxxExxY protein [bacterium]
MEVHNALSKEVVDAAFQIHCKLGPGLLESAYEKILIYELRNRDIPVETQVLMPIKYDGRIFDTGFRADLVVDNILLVELKSIDHATDAHKRQLLTYLRLSGMKLGLLINFGESLIKNGITRIVNGL